MARDGILNGEVSIATFLRVWTSGICLLLAATASAAPGDFDPGFGGNGYVLTKFNNEGNLSYGGGRAISIQPDGRIVVGGSMKQTSTGGGHNFALARYDAGGGLDPSFGTGGLVLTDFGNRISKQDDVGLAMVLQPDGKLVLAGCTLGSASSGSYPPECLGATGTGVGVARYLPDGSLDPGFAGDGRQSITFGTSGNAEARAIGLQPDGKLVLAGYVEDIFATNKSEVLLVRLLPDGQLDSGFGSNGFVVTDAGGPHDEANALVIQPDGKLVVAGYSGTDSGRLGETSGHRDFLLIRYHPDGRPDTGFGTGGVVTTEVHPAPSQSTARALVLQPDGKLVAAGDAGDATARDFALARYLPDGSLDPGFGASGIVRTSFSTTGFSDNRARALLLQGDGKLVAAGYSETALNKTDMALARYLPDGRLDAGFGTGGLVRRDLSGIGESDVVSALALDAAGGLLVAGAIDTEDFPGIKEDGFMVGRLYTIDSTPGGGGGTGGGGGSGGGGSGGGGGNVGGPPLGQVESSDPVRVGQPYTYTVRFTHPGAANATNVKLTDRLPNKTKFASAVASQGRCRGKAPVVCKFGTVRPGATVSATFTLTGKKPGTFTNRALLTYKMVNPGSKRKKPYRLTSSESTTVTP